MHWRMRLFILLILAWLAVCGWRLADLQVLRPDEFALQPFRNVELEARINRGLDDGSIYRNDAGAISITPDHFPPWLERYVQRLIDRGIIRLRDGELIAEPGFTRRVNPNIRRDSPALIRGRILDRHGVPLAWTETVNQRRVRRHRSPEAFGPVLGSTLGMGMQGLEAEYADELKTPDPAILSRVRSFFLHPSHGLDIVTTLDGELQRAAYAAFQGRRGALVALEPSTGDILALVSSPALPTKASMQALLKASDQGEDGPLHNRALRGFYPPGSTFKTVVAAAALDAGVVSMDQALPCTGTYRPSSARYMVHDHETRDRPGFTGHNPHRARRFTLSEAFAVSCNVTFARLGVAAGGDRLLAWTRRFGFYQPIPILGMSESRWNAIPSRMLPLPGETSAFQFHPAQTAQCSIGQFEVRVTPLQMALVASAIANRGSVMKPRIASGVARPDGTILKSFSSETWIAVMNQERAGQLTRLMREAMETGTGRHLQSDRFTIAGKTGTAEVPGERPHGWFIGFAPADSPQIALAVVVENGGYGSQSAGPNAKTILDRYLKRSIEDG